MIRYMEEMGNLEALVCDLGCDFQTFFTSADLWGSLCLFIRLCCHWAINLCSSSTYSVPECINRGSACQSHSLQVYHICCCYWVFFSVTALTLYDMPLLDKKHNNDISFIASFIPQRNKGKGKAVFQQSFTVV